MLVRLEDGDLAEPDGQLHLEFTRGSASGATGNAAGASLLRIIPVPRAAADWLVQGLEHDR